MKNVKKQIKGITLIALVITIVVLLILAGVSIATLTGENGILKQANSAKSKNTEAGLKEQIKLAVLSAKIKDTYDGSINLSTLEEELNNIREVSGIEKQGANEKLPWTVTASGYKFQITESGEVENVDGITLSKTQLKIMAGESETITASLTEGIRGTITWTSSNAGVVSVNGGNITATGTSGTATIKASVTSDGINYEATCEVTIISKVTAISVANLEVGKGDSKTLVVTTTPSSNVEELTYASDNENVATVDNTGKVTGVAEGTATITVAGKISTSVKGTCTVTVTKAVGAPIGDYVTNYGVTYTDMYTGYGFTAENGWRILDGGTKNADGTYSNVKLVSTGVPAKLYYDRTTNAGRDTNGWWGTDVQVEALYGKTYSDAGYDYNNGGYPNRYAAAGLLKNFELIPFVKGTSANANQGCYTKVNTTETGNINGSIFKTAKASEVHNLTLEELNTARNLATNNTSTSTATTDGDTGLFYLRNLANENSEYLYTSSKSPYYWLASPNAGGTSNVWCVNYSGSIGNLYNYARGVRPVVSLNSRIQKIADGKWQIIEQNTRSPM